MRGRFLALAHRVQLDLGVLAVAGMGDCIALLGCLPACQVVLACTIKRSLSSVQAFTAADLPCALLTAQSAACFTKPPFGASLSPLC